MSDRSNLVQVILQAKDLASQTINHVRNNVDKFSEAGDSAGKKAGTLRDNVGSLALSFKNAIAAIGLTVVAYKGFQALLSLPLKGLEFTKQMETAELGIASIIAATQDLTTQDGKRLKGMEKLNAAQKIAADLMKEIQIAGLETVATTEELVSGFQVLLGPAAEAGFTLSQTKDVTVSIVQAMGALGISMNQLSAEGRSLLDGSIIPTQDRLAVALGITGEMVKKWKEQGVLYDELSKKLEPFKLAGADLANTWSGLTSNLREAIAFVASRMTGGLFEDVKASMKTMLDIFIDLKNFDVGSGIKELVEGVREIGTDIGYVIRVGAEAFVALLKQANEYVSKHKEELSAIWETVKQIGSQLWEIIKQVVTFGGEVANAGVEGGFLLNILKFINLMLAAVNDIIGWIVLGFKAVAAIIWNTVVPPLAEVANIVGNILKAIPGFSGIGDALISMAKTWREQQAAVNEELTRSAAQYRDGIAPHTQKALQMNQEIEVSLKKQNAALDDEGVKVEKIRQTYEEWRKGIEKGSETYIKIQAEEIKALEARIVYEKALLDKGLAEKTITYEEHAKKIQALDEQVYNAKIAHIDMTIEAEKKRGEKNYEKVVTLETAKTELTLKHNTERLKIETAAYKETEKLQADGFSEWKALQELRLNTMKANIELQTALDEAAVKAGVLRESTAMRNKLDLTRAFFAEQISIAAETASKQAEIYGTDSAEYQKALAEKEKLQQEYEISAISSEIAIAEAKKKEALEAENFIADILEDSFRKEETQRQEKLNQLHKYYAQGLIAAEDYHDALMKLEKDFTSEFKRELQERTQQLNQMVNIIHDRTNKMWAAVSGFMKQGYDDIRKYFGDAKDALAADITDVRNEITNFLRAVNSGTYNTFWSATLFGRRMVEMVGTSIYEWAGRVAEYIQYVKGLMASLQETLDSYRLQLAQLRGDTTLELEMWYAKEKKQLEEKYKDDLGKTQEYYEAMALLDELYAEKKKKAAEEAAEDEQRIRQESEERARGAAGGGSPGGITGGFPTFDALAQRLKDNILDLGGFDLETVPAGMVVETTVKREIDLGATFKIEGYDIESTDRFIRDVFWPRVQHFLKMKGIEL